MKTVIVFDTDDDRGMRDTYKIMSHLVDQYLMKQIPSRHKLQFGKIEFVKALRAYGDCLRYADKNDKNRDPYSNSIKSAKHFADGIWNERAEGAIKDTL